MANTNLQIDDLRNITRMEYPREGNHGATIGWWVRVMRGTKLHSKLFSDKKYGGKEEALKEAQYYRDKIIEKNEGLLGIGYYKSKTRRNKSGVVGVHRTFNTTKKPSGLTYVYEVWIASWVDPKTGKRKNKSFAISKHGEAGALKKALKAREEAIARISGTKQTLLSSWKEYSLDDLVVLVEDAETSNEKGRALEDLIIRLFEMVPGFSINGIRVKTETEEIDIVLLKGLLQKGICKTRFDVLSFLLTL